MIGSEFSVTLELCLLWHRLWISGCGAALKLSIFTFDLSSPIFIYHLTLRTLPNLHPKTSLHSYNCHSYNTQIHQVHRLNHLKPINSSIPLPEPITLPSSRYPQSSCSLSLSALVPPPPRASLSWPPTSQLLRLLRLLQLLQLFRRLPRLPMALR
jgi:hypothetical protein